MKNITKKILSILLVLAMIVSVIPAALAAPASQELNSGASDGEHMAAAGLKVIAQTTNQVAPGVTYDRLISRNAANQQNIGILTRVDLSQNVTLKASYNGYYTEGSTAQQRANAAGGLDWGFQSTTKQAAAYEAAADTEGTVVMATNGDYFNMGTGEPLGYLVMEGNAVKSTGEPYFAILDDGSAVIRDAGTDASDVKEAISGPFYLVKDGQMVAPEDNSLMPRNSIGICADGSVVFYLNDGRQAPTSVGMTLAEVAAVLMDAGCVNALYLDGGGSATVAARKEGAADLQIVNSPSDGHERDVSSAMLVVSLAEATGVFDHASITPNDELYTPKSQIQFSATGVDTAGTAVEIPGDVTWALAEECAEMGTIDENGLFTANEKTGKVTVQMRQGDKVVGSAFVEIVSPDAIYFENEEASLGFEDVTDFNLVVSYKYRDVNYKVGDIIWTSTNDKLGTFDGNIFTASDGESVTGEVTATSAFDSSVSGTIKVIVGMLPTIVWTFEDIRDEEGNLVQTAEDYYGNLLTHANYGRGGQESIEIVSIDDNEPVRFGEKSLKLKYDFTQCGDVTEGAIIGTTEDFEIPGNPTGIGVWVYVPEGVGIEYQGDGTQAGFWLRGYVNNGSTPINYTLEPKGVLDENGQWNGQQPGIYWSGWMYLEADLTNIQGPYKLYHGNTFRLMFVHGTKMGTRTANSIYFDNLQFVYGTNVDDVDNPKVDTIKIGANELTSGTELTTDTISLRTTFSDVQNKYTSGVDANTVRMFIDGVNVVDNENYNFALNANDGYAELYDLKLLDGQHSVTVTLRDNFGNDASETRYFTVNTGSAAPAVSLKPAEDAAILGSKVNLQIKAEDASVAKLENTIRLSNRFPEPTVTFSENYEGTYTYNATNYTLTISAQRKADASAQDGNLIANVAVDVPANLTANDKFIYELKSGSYQTADGFFTYSAGEQTLAVDAEIAVSAEPILVGGANGILKVTDREGKAVAGAGIYLVADDTLIGTTDENGILETDYFSAAAAKTPVYAKNAEGMPSLHYNVFSYADMADITKAPEVVLFNATGNNATGKSVTWISSSLDSQEQSIRYRAKGTEEWTTVKADSKLLTFATGANNAVNVNSVKLTDLTAGTTYEYQVGAGELWSEVAEMAPFTADGKTSFFVLADIQASDFTQVEMLMDTIAADGYNFGIQTGDAIDTVTDYAEVKSVIDLMSAAHFDDADILRVLGNHEYYGDSAANVASSLYNLPNTTAGGGYSVTYGDVYVATIHFTNTTAELESALAWMVEDAKASDATWKVLALHQPPYYTNATGGNAPVNALVPKACEEAGIDVVFSGHDHALARTNPLTGGEIDEENGIIYVVGGSSGEKSYPVNSQNVFDYEKIFALATDDFNATFIDVSADELELTLNIYDVLPGGEKSLVDSYTLYTEKGACAKDGHDLEEAVFDRETGKLICNKCEMEVDPKEKDFTGPAKDKETERSMYFIEGVAQTGEFLLDQDVFYFDEEGVALQGKHTMDEVEKEFDNGKLVGGYTGFIKKTDGKTYHYKDGAMTYGWHFEGEDLYHFNTTTGAMTTGTKVLPDEEAQSKNAYYDFAEDGKTLRSYFNPKGYYYWAGLPLGNAWVKNGADTDPSAWYRTAEDGHYVTDKYGEETFQLTLDGKTYTAVKIAIDENGDGKDDVVYTFDNTCGKLLLGDVVVNADKTLSYYWAGEPVNHGWFDFNGSKYYAFENGTLATGNRVIDGKAYMFGDDGKLKTEGVILLGILDKDNLVMSIDASNVEKATAVRFALWPEGKDEMLKWYDAQMAEDGQWVAKAAMCEFGIAGTYQLHAYATVEGEESMAAATTVYAAKAAEHTYSGNFDETCNICGEQTRSADMETTPMYRLYNPNSGEHFYTGSVEERDNLVEAGWQYEGIAWNAPVHEGAPVYRVYNPNSGDHHYTMSKDEVDMLVDLGWIYEGVAWNSASEDHIPQFRLYNPNADCGSHHYTSSMEEREYLVSLGWIYEGIGWFGMLK